MFIRTIRYIFILGLIIGAVLGGTLGFATQAHADSSSILIDGDGNYLFDNDIHPFTDGVQSFGSSTSMFNTHWANNYMVGNEGMMTASTSGDFEISHSSSSEMGIVFTESGISQIHTDEPAGAVVHVSSLSPGVYEADAVNFFWDDVNMRLGVGTSSPSSKLTVWGDGLSDIFEAITSAAASAFVIKDSGNVGIGTTNPGETLEVNGSVFLNSENMGLIVDASGNKRVGFMKYVGHEAGIWRSSSQSFEIGRTDGADITTSSPSVTDLYIDGDGNVGIGTTTPSAQLSLSNLLYVGGTGTSTIQDNLEILGGLRVDGPIIKNGQPFESLYTADATISNFDRTLVGENSAALFIAMFDETTADFTGRSVLNMTDGIMQIGFASGNGLGATTGNSNITINENNMIVSDGHNSKGWENAADYTLNFTEHSLITKGYVSPSNVIIISKQADWDALETGGVIYVTDDLTLILRTSITDPRVALSSGVNFSILGERISTAALNLTGANTMITATSTPGPGFLRIDGINQITGGGTATLFDVASSSIFVQLSNSGVFGFASCGTISDSAQFRMNAGLFNFGAGCAIDDVDRVFITDMTIENASDMSDSWFEITGTGDTQVSVNGTNVELQPNESLIDIDNSVTSGSRFEIGSNILSGATTEIFDATGVMGDDIRVDARNNTGNKDSESIGGFTVFDNSTATVIPGIDTWVPLEFTHSTSSVSMERWELADTASSTLRYLGLEPFSGDIKCTSFAFGSGSNQVYKLRAVKNGLVFGDHSMNGVDVGNNGGNPSLEAGVTAITDDEIEIEVKNTEGTSNITFEDLTCFIR